MIKWKFCLSLPSCLLWFVNLRDTPLCVKEKPYLLASQRSPEVGAGRQGWVVAGTSLSISVRSSGVLGSSWGRRGEEMGSFRVKRDEGRFDLSFCSFPQICLQSVLQKDLEKWLDSEHNYCITSFRNSSFTRLTHLPTPGLNNPSKPYLFEDRAWGLPVGWSTHSTPTPVRLETKAIGTIAKLATLKKY